MREREAKLAPPPGFRLPDLDLPGLHTERAEPLLLQTTYYDSSDLRLTRWGASLRYRNDEGWTVKLPDSTRHGATQGVLLSRTEHRFPGGPGTPPGGALDLVTAYLRHGSPSPVTRLRTLRRRLALRDASGRVLAEVIDDEVSVLDGRRVGARFRELEVELAEDAPEAVAEAVVDRLREAGAGNPDPVPKVVRALGPHSLDPPDVAPDTRVGAGSTAGDVVRHAIAQSVRRLLVHDAGVRLGDDVEDVHQARVATRRLRSDLRTFRRLLDPEWTSELRTELRWLGAKLGAVRDADVQLDRLWARVGELSEPDRAAASPFLQALGAHREAARAELLDGVRSSRYLDLLDRLVDAAHAPAFQKPDEVEGGPAPDAPAAGVLPGLARGPWRHLRNAVAALPDDPADAALHAVRILAKRARYAAEAVAPVAGKGARELGRALADVQDVLGEHQDAVVAEAWLRELANSSTGEARFAAGQLVMVERRAADASRSAWRAAWSAASRKRLRTWM